ncbi:hypothetical protein [Flavobacterium sp. N502540]|uniref:hypothetical protein n=1 Tax=Flavobacterium sp. N502540 TaxID=2986838 RepID=UPI0022241FD8|nr:hypothetical protein [Flavobacterium sp. N502540]
MKRFHLILIILLGIFLIPTTTVACEKPVEKPAVKEKISKTEKEDDCCKISDSNDKNPTNNSGKCKRSACGCASSCNGGIIALNEHFSQNILWGASTKKQKFHNLECPISSGFQSLWLIPKIS